MIHILFEPLVNLIESSLGFECLMIAAGIVFKLGYTMFLGWLSGFDHPIIRYLRRLLGAKVIAEATSRPGGDPPATNRY